MGALDACTPPPHVAHLDHLDHDWGFDIGKRVCLGAVRVVFQAVAPLAPLAPLVAELVAPAEGAAVEAGR